MTVSLASRGQQPICFKQEWWENMTVIYQGKKWYYRKAFEVAKSQLQGQQHRWVIESWMWVLWFKLGVTVTSFEFFRAKCVSRAPETQNSWYLTTRGGASMWADRAYKFNSTDRDARNLKRDRWKTSQNHLFKSSHGIESISQEIFRPDLRKAGVNDKPAMTQ